MKHREEGEVGRETGVKDAVMLKRTKSGRTRLLDRKGTSRKPLLGKDPKMTNSRTDSKSE